MDGLRYGFSFHRKCSYIKKTSKLNFVLILGRSQTIEDEKATILDMDARATIFPSAKKIPKIRICGRPKARVLKVWLINLQGVDERNSWS